jgi:hypothetical protein
MSEPEEDIVELEDLRAGGVLGAARRVGVGFLGLALIMAVLGWQNPQLLARSILAGSELVVLGLAFLVEPRLFIALGRQHRAVPSRFRTIVIMTAVAGVVIGVGILRWLAA